MVQGVRGVRAAPLTVDDLRAWVIEIQDAPVRNINPFGMSLDTGIPLGIGQRYAFHLKSDGRAMTLEGEVCRCQLNKLVNAGSGGHVPRYDNGIQFRIERNQKETLLQALIQDHLVGERRLGATRIIPSKRLVADVGSPCFSMIREFSARGLLAEGDTLLDMDEEWRVMVQAGDESVLVNCRILHASKKARSDHFRTRLEFLKQEDKDRRSLDRMLSQIHEPS